MRVRTLEIRWHDQKPISTCDFQPISASRKPRASREQIGSTSYRLATGGEAVAGRFLYALWFMAVLFPLGLARPPEYRAPLSRCRLFFLRSTPDAAPTTRRISLYPDQTLWRGEYSEVQPEWHVCLSTIWFVRVALMLGELIASAGDDGMIIIWVQTDRPVAAAYGSEGVADEDPEHWKVRISFRCTTNEIYDLAWSPTGEYVIAGSTDNAARIFSVADGTCVRELAEHTHHVQGVAWDPMNKFIATQSSDRAVHVYSVSTKQGALETHAVGRNMRMNVRHSRMPSASTSAGRPRIMRRSSTTSDAESSISEVQREDAGHAPPTPATSIASTPTMFPPPQVERPSSRRSSFRVECGRLPCAFEPRPFRALALADAASPRYTAAVVWLVVLVLRQVVWRRKLHQLLPKADVQPGWRDVAHPWASLKTRRLFPDPRAARHQNSRNSQDSVNPRASHCDVTVRARKEPGSPPILVRSDTWNITCQCQV